MCRAGDLIYANGTRHQPDGSHIWCDYFFLFALLHIHERGHQPDGSHTSLYLSLFKTCDIYGVYIRNIRLFAVPCAMPSSYNIGPNNTIQQKKWREKMVIVQHPPPPCAAQIVIVDHFFFLCLLFVIFIVICFYGCDARRSPLSGTVASSSSATSRTPGTSRCRS